MLTVRLRLLGLFVFCAVLSTLTYATVTAQDAPYPWATGTPSLQKQQVITVSSSSPAPAGISGNDYDCTKQSFTWRPEKNIGAFNYQAEAKMDVCAFNVVGGKASNVSYFLPGGASVAGRITGPSPVSNGLLFVPNSSSVIEIASVTGGVNLRIINGAYSGLQVTKASDGSVVYKITKTSPQLKNKFGVVIKAQLSTMAYSDDGGWAVVDAPGTGLLRINLKTQEVLPFAVGYDYSGTSPSLQTAISNSGRYAIVSSPPNDSFKIYDLGSCTAPTTGMVYTCQSRDIRAYLKTQEPKLYGSAEKVRFITDDTFSFYATYDRISSSNRKIGFYTLTTPGVSVAKIDYLAMGDSFASGEGAYSYRDGTNFTDNRCHQSEVSYPYLLDALVGTNTFKSVACSGAKVWDVMTTDREAYSNNPQSKNKLDESYDFEILNNYLPGYRGQLGFVKSKSPGIVTISTGGNDIGFSAIIQKCVLGPDTCYSSYEDRLEIVRRINDTYPQLLDMYKSIKKSSAMDAKVYVIGYPQIAKPGGNCGVNVHFDNDEIIFGSQLISYLNSVIKMAADTAGVAYIDTENAFTGHRLCEATYSNIAVNGLTRGKSAPIPGVGVLGSESYHPNAMGHQLFSSTIFAATNGFQLASPAPKTSNPVFAAESSIELLNNAGKTNRSVLNTKYSNNLSGDYVYTEQSSLITASATDYSLKPNTTFSLTLYSTPTNLGNVTSDANGDINSSFAVPNSVEPGYHTLHLVGNNINDEVIDIQKIIYVAASSADFDGDGVLNENEACIAGTESGIDEDKDGIDDACDAQISEPPVEPPVVDVPIIESTDKNLPEPESNPQWLLDLTVQKQAELTAQLLAATATIVTPQPAPQTTTSNQQQEQVVQVAPSNTPATVVAGINTVATSVPDSAVEPKATLAKQSPELAVLITALGMLGLGVVLILWKLNQA